MGFVFILLADYIIAGSFAAYIALPITTYLMGYEMVLIVIATAMTVLIFYLHRGNIQRILAKEETKISDVIKKE